MESYILYKTLHLAALLFAFTALGGQAVLTLLGDARNEVVGRVLLLVHSAGMLIVLVVGTRMVEILAIPTRPDWLYPKLADWILLADFMFVLRRSGRSAGNLFLLVPSSWGRCNRCRGRRPFGG